MLRRTYVGLLSAAVLSGCSGSPSSADERDLDDGDEQGSSPTPTSEPSDPADFKLDSVTAPAEAEIGEEIGYAFTVVNTGEEEGEFETTISTRIGASGRWETSSPWRETIPAGGSVTLESQTFSYDYVDRIDIRIDTFDHIFSIQFLSRKLPFGRPYVTPEGMQFTVTGIDLQNSYDWEGASGTNYTENAPSGSQFAFLNVHAENKAGQPLYSPNSFDIVLLSGQHQYEPAFISKSEGEYDAAELQPGVVRRGWISYEVDAGLEESDITAVWSETYLNGDVVIHWSDGGGTS